jgi:hypothetical protein
VASGSALAAAFVAARALPFAGSRLAGGVDTLVYESMARQPVTSRAFFAGDRPLGYPLYLKVVHHNQTAATVGQLAVGVLAWLALALVAARATRDPVLRIAVATVVLAIGASFDVIQWDLAVSTDSLSVSLCVGALAAALWLRERWTASRLAVLVALVFAAAAERDSNGAFLGAVAVVALVAILVRALPRRALVVCVALIFAAALSTSSANAGHRSDIPLRDVITLRVLTSPERTAFLLSRGLPLSRREIAAARGQCANPTPMIGCATIDNPRFYSWIHERGRAAYLALLARFPATTLSEPMEHLDWSLGTRVRLERQTGERAPVSQLLETVVFIRNPLVLLISAAVVITSSVLLRRRRGRGPYVIASALILLTYFHLWLVWSGGALEVTRHSLVASIQLRLGLWLGALWIVDALIVARRASDDTVFGSAPASPLSEVSN